MKPFLANYFLTLKCELACAGCPFWELYEDFPEDASLETTLKNLEVLAAAGIKLINFTGGDCLLYPDFPKVLEFARKLHLKTIVTTGGLYYPDLSEKIKGLANYLGFCLAAHNQESFTNAAGFDYFDKIISAVRLSRRLGEKTFLRLMLDRDNVNFLQEAVELAVSLKTPLWIRPSFKNDESGNFRPETFSYIKRYINHPAVFVNPAPFEFLKKIQRGKDVQNKICRAGQFQVTVRPDGQLGYPCFYRPVFLADFGAAATAAQFLSAFKRQEISRDIPECRSCRDWDYLEPSFFYGLNRYNWFNIYGWGKYFWKRTFSPFFK